MEQKSAQLNKTNRKTELHGSHTIRALVDPSLLFGYNPTYLFTISKLQNPSHDLSELYREFVDRLISMLGRANREPIQQVGSPTGPFTILEPLSPDTGAFYVVQKVLLRIL